MIKSQIGINAGKVWQFLDEKKESSLKEIKSELSLKNEDLWLALGWLARENKVFFYKENKDYRITLVYD